MCKKGEGHKCPKCGLRWGNEVCMNGTCCVSGRARKWDGSTLECGPCNGGVWQWHSNFYVGYIIDGECIRFDDPFDAWAWKVRHENVNSTK